MNSKNKPGVKISISFKLISIISLLIIFSLALMTFLASIFFKDDTEALIQNNNHKISELTALNIKSTIESLIEKSILLGNSLILEDDTIDSPDLVNKQNRDYSSLLLPQSTDIFFIGVAHKDKKGGLTIDKSISSNDFLNELGMDENKIITLSEQFEDNFKSSFNMDIVFKNLSPAFNWPVIGVSIPFIRKNDKEADSILIVLSKNNKFQKSIKSEKSIGITTTFLLSSNGEVIAHPDKSKVIKNENLSKLPIFNASKTAIVNNGQMKYNIGGNKTIWGSFQMVDISGLVVITTVDEEKALTAVYKIERQNILITIIIVFSAMIIIFLFAKTLTNPIKRLVSATGEIEAGNFDVQIRSNSRDEIGLLTNSFVQMGHGLAEREKMKDAFGKFVNKDIAGQVLKGEIKLGGERKKTTIFFSDIRSFTAISEKLQPEEVVEFLNEYMTRMVSCVNRNHGVVDKFIGDAIMAVWGTPISRGNDAENAVNASLEMRSSLIEFNKGRGSRKKPIIEIGCGLNTGDVLAGQIGSQERMEYTVIGDAVNLASRIEALNKPFKTDIIVSEDTYEEIKDIFDFSPLKKIMVKGKKNPQRIFAVLKRKDDENGPRDLKDLRDMLGLKAPTARSLESQIQDRKYEIID